MSEEKPKKPGPSRKAVIGWTLGIATALVVYVGSYLAWSRLFPAKEFVSGGVRHYTFVPGDPDWEHTFYAFYYPLIRIDQAMGGREHFFDVDYI